MGLSIKEMEAYQDIIHVDIKNEGLGVTNIKNELPF